MIALTYTQGSDYGVVFGLDVRGLKPELEFEQIVLKRMFLREFKLLRRLVDDLQNMGTEDPEQLLEEVTSAYETVDDVNPVNPFLRIENGAALFMRFLQEGPTDNILFQLSGCKRYLTDIDFDRVVEVELVAQPDNLRSEDQITSIYRNDELQKVAQVEYHGTSLQYALEAFPQLQQYLPKSVRNPYRRNMDEDIRALERQFRATPDANSLELLVVALNRSGILSVSNITEFVTYILTPFDERQPPPGPRSAWNKKNLLTLRHYTCLKVIFAAQNERTLRQLSASGAGTIRDAGRPVKYLVIWTPDPGMAEAVARWIAFLHGLTVAQVIPMACGPSIAKKYGDQGFDETRLLQAVPPKVEGEDLPPLTPGWGFGGKSLDSIDADPDAFGRAERPRRNPLDTSGVICDFCGKQGITQIIFCRPFMLGNVPRAQFAACDACVNLITTQNTRQLITNACNLLPAATRREGRKYFAGLYHTLINNIITINAVTPEHIFDLHVARATSMRQKCQLRTGHPVVGGCNDLAYVEVETPSGWKKSCATCAAQQLGLQEIVEIVGHSQIRSLRAGRRKSRH
jgi:hypothetical protein